ncbi:GNAT family N-acetyltransferase [Aquihabitans daechungensis]|uniref:GNAT family N-acetyltransferase n=1 Tax=Aquihabitans daechungensis TaxID=1052257 RepID=UPI003BA185EE
MGSTADSVVIAGEDPATPDAQVCLRAYYAVLDERFDQGFDVEAALPLPLDELRPPNGRFLVARIDGRAVACGCVKFHGEEPAEIKRMWVDESVRGRGLGRQMLRTLEDVARAGGALAVQLETNRNLPEAVAMYRSSGYDEVEPFNDEPYGDHWFQKSL